MPDLVPRHDRAGHYRARSLSGPLALSFGLHLAVAAGLILLTRQSPSSLQLPLPLPVTLVSVQNPERVAPPVPLPSPVRPAVQARSVEKPKSSSAIPIKDIPAATVSPQDIAVSSEPPDPQPGQYQTPPLQEAGPVSSSAEAVEIVAAQYTAAYLDNPAPGYPEEAYRRQQEGEVRLRVRVGVQGQALTVALERSSGVRALDVAALKTVQRWRFIPARRNAQPIEDTIIVPIRFQLKD